MMVTLVESSKFNKWSLLTFDDSEFAEPTLRCVSNESASLKIIIQLFV